MRKVAVLVLFFAAALPAAGDSVTLATGGEVKGAIVEVIFLHNNVEKKLSCGDFVGIHVNRDGADRLQPREGEAWQGELLSVRIRSTGGLLGFGRAEIQAVEVALPDSVELAAGRTVNGIIEGIVVRTDGEKLQALRRDALRSLTLSAEGVAAVELANEATETGELVSLRILPAVGRLEFAGDEIVSVSVVPTDTIVLKAGGRLWGTVEEIVLSQGAETRTLRRGEFAEVRLAPEAEDVVALTGGAEATGRVISLRGNVAGVALSLRGEEVSRIVICETARDRLRRTFLRERAQIKEGDAAALLALASWCKDRGLSDDARELARQALAGNPDEETAILAHRLLGHVFRDGRWEEPGAAQRAAPVDTKSVDPALVAVAREVFKEYAAKVEAAKKQDLDAVKANYSADWEAILAAVKKLEARIESIDRARSQLRDRITDRRRDLRGRDATRPLDYTEIRMTEELEDFQRMLSALGRDLDVVKSFGQSAKLVRTALGNIIRARMADVTSRDRARNQSLTTARYRVERLLLENRELTEAQVRAALEEELRGSLEPMALEKPPRPKIDFKAASALVELGDQFRRRAQEMTDRERRAVEDSEAANYDSAQSGIRQLEATARRMRNEKATLEGQFARETDEGRRAELRAQIDRLDREIARYDGLIASREQYAQRILARIRSEMQKIRRQATDREDALNRVWDKVSGDLRQGKEVGETEIQNLFEQAIRDEP